MLLSLKPVHLFRWPCTLAYFEYTGRIVNSRYCKCSHGLMFFVFVFNIVTTLKSEFKKWRQKTKERDLTVSLYDAISYWRCWWEASGSEWSTGEKILTGKTAELEVHVSDWRFVQHTTHMNWRGIKTGAPQWEAVNWPPVPCHGSEIIWSVRDYEYLITVDGIQGILQINVYKLI